MTIPTDGNWEFAVNGDPASQRALDNLERLAIDLTSKAPAIRFRSYGHQQNDGNMVVFSSEYDEAEPIAETVSVAISSGQFATTALQITYDPSRKEDAFRLFTPPDDEDAIHVALQIADALMEGSYHDEVERKVVSDLFTLAAVKAMETGSSEFVTAKSVNYLTPQIFAATVGTIVMQHASEGVRNRSFEGSLYDGDSLISVSTAEVLNTEDLPEIPGFPVLTIEYIDMVKGRSYCYTKNVAGDQELESDIISDEDDEDTPEGFDDYLAELNELLGMDIPGARDVEALTKVLEDAGAEECLDPRENY